MRNFLAELFVNLAFYTFIFFFFYITGWFLFFIVEKMESFGMLNAGSLIFAFLVYSIFTTVCLVHFVKNLNGKGDS